MRTVGICIASKHNTNTDAVVALILWQNIQFFLASKVEPEQTKPAKLRLGRQRWELEEFLEMGLKINLCADVTIQYPCTALDT